MFPLSKGSNHMSPAEQYASDFIAQNYSFPLDEVDLQRKTGAYNSKTSNIYRGSSFLTNAADRQMERAIGHYFLKNMSIAGLQRFLQEALGIDPDKLQTEEGDRLLRDNVAQLIDWYLADHGIQLSAETIRNFTNIPKPGLENSKTLHDKFMGADGFPLKNEDGTLPIDAESGLDIIGWLENEVINLDDFFAEEAVEGYAEQRKLFLNQNIEKLVDWYTASSHLLHYGIVYKLLAGHHILGQALSGLNDGMLMHRQTMELRIGDPLGFEEEYQPFTHDLVAPNVGYAPKRAPQPLNAFNPIRTGDFHFYQMRLVDTFGVVRKLDIDELFLPKTLAKGNRTNSIRIPPRVVQPARINLRFLAEVEGEVDKGEMIELPSTLPINGWVLSNKLDRSLMFYNPNGLALGYLILDREMVDPAQPHINRVSAKWMEAPGGDGVKRPDDIPNLHLKTIIKRIQSLTAATINRETTVSFLESLQESIDAALFSIAPEGFEHDQARALLMGHPLAIIRVVANLELKGVPAVHQGWSELELDMDAHRDYFERENNGFDQVQFPIRIGDHTQLNDGVIGFWKENKTGAEDLNFYLPHQHDALDDRIITQNDDPQGLDLHLSFDGDPQMMTVFLDPRGKLHATSGIFPTKVIDIPPEQYADALQQIEVTFRAMPVLTPLDRVELPLPKENGYAWSWIEEFRSDQWMEISEIGIVRKFALAAAFESHLADTEALWTELLAAGWLVPYADFEDRALIVSDDQRNSQVLPDEFQDIQQAVINYLDRLRISPMDSNAHFSGRMKIREGWLQLKKV